MNYDKVTSGLYRGPHLQDAFKSKMPPEAFGIRSVLNLQRGYFEFLHGTVNTEIEECARRGILPVHLPLGDLKAPSIAELNAALDLINMLIGTCGAVYVHCLHGVDRTGMVIAAHRIACQTWSFEKARDEMFEKGFHRFPYEALGWVKRLEEFSKEYKQ